MASPDRDCSREWNPGHEPDSERHYGQLDREYVKTDGNLLEHLLYVSSFFHILVCLKFFFLKYGKT